MKLVLSEDETEALVDYLDERRTRLATSIVAEVEVGRAVGAAGGGAREEELADRVLGQCMRLALEAPVLAAARGVEPAALRSLDAIHLASAVYLEPDAMLVYDRRLADAARAAGLEVLAPGT